jgi:hypothetical protein
MRRLGWTHDFSGFLAQPGLVDDLVPGLRGEIEAMVARPGDILDQAGLLWNVIHTVIDRYRRDHPDWTFVRHEDLSAAPRDGFRDLAGRVGLDFTPQVQAYVAETTRSGNPAEAGRGVVHELRRDSAASARTWHARLTPDEVARVRARTGAVASAFYSDAEWRPAG